MRDEFKVSELRRVIDPDCCTASGDHVTSLVWHILIQKLPHNKRIKLQKIPENLLETSHEYIFLKFTYVLVDIPQIKNSSLGALNKIQSCQCWYGTSDIFHTTSTSSSTLDGEWNNHWCAWTSGRRFFISHQPYLTTEQQIIHRLWLMTYYLQYASSTYSLRIIRLVLFSGKSQTDQTQSQNPSGFLF